VLAARGAARTVGVFVDEPAERVARLVERLALDVVQLHGSERPEDVRALRDGAGVTIWKAVRVRAAAGARETIAAWASHVDGVLLDGYSSAGAGGTGTRFDWDALTDVRELVPVGVTLGIAGGLHAGNVANAIEVLGPDLVDTSSGVEVRPGVKSHERIRAFVEAARVQRKGTASG
jgi:phosphoribosylanthranilate isomerase